MCYDLTPPNNDPSILGTITVNTSAYPTFTSLPTLTTSDLSTLGTIDLTTIGNLTITPNNYSTGSLWGGLYNHSDGKQLHVSGDAEIQGNLTVNGVDVSQALAQINQRLAILKPNKELESRWERLKALADEYRTLEKEILEQEKIYDILKK